MTPRLVVLVASGKLAGEKAVVEPGGEITVGGRAPSSLLLAHDPKVSACHCRIRWSGERATIEDLESLGGILVEGRPETATELASGAWIRVGGTDLFVHVEGFTAPPPMIAARRDEHLETKLGLSLELAGEAETRFAVLDAARDPRILSLLRESVDPFRSLYDGTRGEALESTAPHLVELERESALAARLLFEGWGHRWGLFFAAPARLREVRRHLRRFLMVFDEAVNAKYYFRFYDPRTLRVFLRAATVRQRAELFGPITRFWAEEQGGAAIIFERDAEALA